jgi:hypothetical protein
METLLTKLDRCPPFVCYYAAHMGRKARPMLPELVKASGMSERTFVRIAQRTTWAGVTVERLSQFSGACGIDVLNPQTVLEWLATRISSGLIGEDFGACRGQGDKMLERFNLLAAQSVMAKERH